MSEYAYSILAEYHGHAPGDVADLLLEELAEHSPAVSVGHGQISVRLSLVYSIGHSHSWVARAAEELVERALRVIGAEVELEALTVETEEHLERALAEPLPELVGLSEIARILGVSKQRVGQLRERPDFPRPIAELAAGPVWSRPMLDRFTHEWPRRAGRPRAAAKSA